MWRIMDVDLAEIANWWTLDVQFILHTFVHEQLLLPTTRNIKISVSKVNTVSIFLSFGQTGLLQGTQKVNSAGSNGGSFFQCLSRIL